MEVSSLDKEPLTAVSDALLRNSSYFDVGEQLGDVEGAQGLHQTLIICLISAGVIIVIVLVYVVYLKRKRYIVSDGNRLLIARVETSANMTYS